MNLKGISIGSVMKYWDVADKIISGVETLFGKGKGAEKKAAAMDTLAGAIALYEGLIHKDQVNDPVVLGLMSQLIETVLKAQKDVAAIEAQLRTAIEVAKTQTKGTGLPVD